MARCFEQNRELIASQTCRRVSGSDCLLKKSGEVTQHGITGIMAEAVVDVLESVEVQKLETGVCTTFAWP